MMHALPHCDDLFLRFFDPWYDDAGRRRRGFKATFPDVMQHESLVGLSQAQASRVVAEAQNAIMQHIGGMLDATRHDWPTYLPVSGDISQEWIGAFDRYYDRERIHEVIERSEPSNFSNDYVVLCCEFGAVLSYVLRAAQPRLIWRLDWPYWVRRSLTQRRVQR